ncbi:MAG: hypothetical protein EU535_02735 [Promethearchaeota archaeon]|nr:MAG: hypothetical protein EU535_02735 [Candidatus Lokiarchaeota archaeon]
MNFEKTTFGSITIDGNQYNHDLYLLVDGIITERDKSHSKHISGHRELSKWELEQLITEGPDILIIGMGQSGVLPISKETKFWLESLKTERNIKIIQDKTPLILDKTNEALRSNKKVAGIFHITC